MNTDTHLKSSTSQLSEAANDAVHQAAVAAKNFTGVAEDVAKDTYQTLSSKVEDGIERTKEYAQHAVDTTKDTLETSKAYVRRNPVPVVLGAFAFGAALGCLLMMARRKPTFGERYAEEPLVAVREAILGALTPVTQRVHKGYDSARDGAGKVMDRVHNFGSCRSGNSVSDQIGRIGNNLKFW